MSCKKSWLLSLLSSALVFISSALAPLAYADEIIISSNGSGSSNETTVNLTTTTSVTQTNNASVTNNVDTQADTGGNNTSGNSGGTVAIGTGDIDTSIAVDNKLNSSVVEIPCCESATFLTISGNGADSDNQINLSQNTQTNVQINQNANVTNSLTGTANTGNNQANSNTGGNVGIQTGNITVTGGIVNGPINVYNISGASGGGSLLASISDNGSGSTNVIAALLSNVTFLSVSNSAWISNPILWNLNTGGNVASGNVGGDVRISTGDIVFDFLVKNDPINFGSVEWTCCPLGVTPPPPPPPPPTCDPCGDGGGPSPSPSPSPSPQDGGGVSDGGGGGGSSPSWAGGGPTLLGLSATGADSLRIFGMIMLSGGIFILANGKKIKRAKA